MKRSFITLLSILLFNVVFAQQDSLPVYKRFPELPPFTFTKVPDSTKFGKADLKKKKATVIMVFSPDCDHCHHATKDLLAHMELFKDVQIIMAAPLEYKLIMDFYKEFNIGSYPNITMGRDGTYFLGTFFNIRNYPSIFLYDKKGNFKEEFSGTVSFEKIATYL